MKHTDLIGAAPDLLAACHEALLVLPYDYQMENELLRQAIAKATGTR